MQRRAHLGRGDPLLRRVHAAARPVEAARLRGLRRALNEGGRARGEPRAQVVLEPAHRLALLLENSRLVRTVVVDVVHVMWPHLDVHLLDELVAARGDIREVALLVHGVVQLLAHHPFAEVHVDVVLLGIGTVALNARRRAAPARIACGDALEAERRVVWLVRQDVVGDVGTVLAEVALSREVEVVISEFREGRLECPQRVRVRLCL